MVPFLNEVGIMALKSNIFLYSSIKLATLAFPIKSILLIIKIVGILCFSIILIVSLSKDFSLASTTNKMRSTSSSVEVAASFIVLPNLELDLWSPGVSTKIICASSSV